ncbi:MAG: calcium-binding protein [Pseudomonadota bacterium]
MARLFSNVSLTFINDFMIGKTRNERLVSQSQNELVAGVDAADYGPILIAFKGADLLSQRPSFNEFLFTRDDGSLLFRLDDFLIDGDNAQRYIDNPNSVQGILFEGNDDLTGSADADLLSGFGGNDMIRGRQGDDRIAGDGGNDTVLGGGGNDTISGGGGADRLIADGGDDRVNAGGGSDVIRGGGGDDMLNGGGGRDDINAGGGSDSVKGGGGADVINLGSGDDVGKGKGGADVMKGQRGDDLLLGGGANDTMKGGDGDDMLFGSVGDDRLVGNAGADILVGGMGNDALIGGGGNDVFVFADGDGADRIIGFNIASGDVIDLSDVTLATGFEDLAHDHLNQVGNDVIIDLGDTVITLVGKNADRLDADEFIFG